MVIGSLWFSPKESQAVEFSNFKERIAKAFHKMFSNPIHRNKKMCKDCQCDKSPQKTWK